MPSFQTTISPKRRVAARFVVAVRRAIQQALIEEYRSRKLTQAQIARELGVHRSVINREIRGEGNLTLSRIGELAAILGRNPQFALPKRVARSSANIRIEDGKTETTAGLQRIELGEPKSTPSGVSANWGRVKIHELQVAA